MGSGTLTRVRKRLWLVLASLVASIGFGIGDEMLTRLGGSLHGVALVANSRLVWAAWPVAVGLFVGHRWIGAVAAALGTPAALLGFYMVHGDGPTQALVAAGVWFPAAALAGALLGAIGSLARGFVEGRCAS